VSQPVPGVGIGAWLTAIIFLGVLAAGGYYLVRWVRRLQGGTVSGIGGVRVLARVTVSMNHSVVLLEMVDHVLVVGVGDAVTLIERIDDKAVVKRLLAEAAGPADGPFALFRTEARQVADFRRVFDEAIGRLRQRTDAPGRDHRDDA